MEKNRGISILSAGLGHQSDIKKGKIFVQQIMDLSRVKELKDQQDRRHYKDRQLCHQRRPYQDSIIKKYLTAFGKLRSGAGRRQCRTGHGRWKLSTASGAADFRLYFFRLSGYHYRGPGRHARNEA